MKTHRWLWWSVGLTCFFCIGCCSLLWDVPPPSSSLRGVAPPPRPNGQKRLFTDEVPCGERQVHLRATFDQTAGQERTPRLHAKAARWLLACDQWHAVFSWLLPLSQARPGDAHDPPAPTKDLLTTLQAEQYDVMGQLKRWLIRKRHWRQRKHKGTSLWRHRKSDQRAAAMIFGWLQKRPNASSLCGPVMAEFRRWSSPVKREALPYLTAARCGAWRQRLRRALSHPNPHNRSQACRLLARHGDGSDLARIVYLSTSDPASIHHGSQLSYPVREACGAAYKARLLGRPAPTRP